MSGAGELILHTITGLMSIAFLAITGRYLWWPAFKKRPVLVGTIFAVGVAAIVLMIALSI
jgi:hypothetical protein